LPKKHLSLVKNTAYTFLTQIPVQFLGIVSGIFITRILGPEGKGVYAIYHANALLLVTFFSFSLASSLAYFVSSKKITLDKMTGIGLIAIGLGSLLTILTIVILVFLNSDIFFFPDDYQNTLYYLWMGLFAVTSIANSTLTGFFQGMKKFKSMNRIALSCSILNLVCFAGLYYIHTRHDYQAEPLSVLYLLFAVTFFNLFLYLFAFRKIVVKPVFRFNLKKDIYPLVKFTIYSHVSIFINFFNYRLSLWVLAYYLDEYSIGIYSLSANIVAMFTMISMPISSVIMPYMAEEKDEIRHKIFTRYSRLNLTAISFLMVIAFFISDIIIPWVYGAEFYASALPFKILLPGVLLACQTKLFATFIISYGKQQYNLIATAIGFVASLPLNILLISAYGVVGAALSTSATFLSVFITVALFAHIKLGLPLVNYFLLSLRDIKQIYSERKRIL
jgi:O-antigen/teichoic acid export membrane protein